MKAFILTAIILIFSVHTNARVSEEANKDSEKSKNSANVILSGSIIDENSGESLVGVEVQLEGTNLKTYTDFDGKFSFDNVKPGDCKITVNYISYKKESKKLELESRENEIKIKLQTSD